MVNFKITKDLLRQFKTSELTTEGMVYYIEDDQGNLHKCELQFAWYPTRRCLNEFRARTVELSKAGKLWTRRDQAFKDFRDMLEN